jgi:hypothetical protein
LQKFNIVAMQSEERAKCRYIQQAFPQRGGIIGAFVCFGWLIRGNLWILTAAWCVHAIFLFILFCFIFIFIFIFIFCFVLFF